MTPWRRGRRPAAGQGLKGRGDAKNGARLVADLDEKSGLKTGSPFEKRRISRIRFLGTGLEHVRCH